MRTAPSPARNQSHLRRQIAALERLQATRRAMVEEQKRQLDEAVERADRELENLRAQQTMRTV